MTQIGVYDDQGIKVLNRNIKEHFGYLHRFIQMHDEYVKYRDREHADTSVTTVTGALNWCPLKLFMSSRYDVFTYYKSKWIPNKGSLLHQGIFTDDDDPVVLHEPRLMYQIEGNGSVSGHIDRLAPHKISDLKTKAFAIPKEYEPGDLLQLQFYEYMLRQPETVVTLENGTVIPYSLIQKVYLPIEELELIYAGAVKWRLDTIKFEPLSTQDFLDKVKYTLERTFTYSKEAPVLDKACRSCEYNRLCTKGIKYMKTASKRDIQIASPPAFREDEDIRTWEEILKV